MENLSNAESVRLDLVKALIPVTSRIGLQNPEQIVEIARELEQYVLQGSSDAGDGETAKAESQPNGHTRPQRRNTQPTDKR